MNLTKYANLARSAAASIGGPAAGAAVGAAFSAGKSLANRVQAMANRPRRAERARARAAKPGLPYRVTAAAAQSGAILARATTVAAAQPAQAVHIVGNEVMHTRTHVVKLAEELADKGILSSGDRMKDARRGGLHIGDHYFNLNDFVLFFSMLKAVRPVKLEARPSDLASLEGLKSLIAPKTTPQRAFDDIRYVGAVAEQAVRPDDIVGIARNPDGTFTVIHAAKLRADKTPWPMGTVIFAGSEMHLAVDWRAAIKVAGAVFAWTRENTWAKVAALFPETIGDLAGLARGLDLNVNR